MEMPKLSDAHRQLERFVGNWTGEEKIAPSPWDPQGGSAIGRVNNRLALDGFVVVQDYEQERNGAVTFRGHGVFSYDPNQDCYLMHWWDSMGMPPNVFKGNFDGQVATLVCEDGPMKSRATFDLGDNNYSFRMEVSQDGANWMTFMEGTYARQGASGAAA
jgi:hypothetical protein